MITAQEICFAISIPSYPAEYDKLGAIWRNYLQVGPGNRAHVERVHRNESGVPASVWSGKAHRFVLPDSYRPATFAEAARIAEAIREWGFSGAYAAEAKVVELLEGLRDGRMRPSPEWEEEAVAETASELKAGATPAELIGRLIGEHQHDADCRVIVTRDDAERIVRLAARQAAISD